VSLPGFALADYCCNNWQNYLFGEIEMLIILIQVCLLMLTVYICYMGRSNKLETPSAMNE